MCTLMAQAFRGQRFTSWGDMMEPTVHGGHFGLGVELGEEEDNVNAKEQAVSLTKAKKPKLSHRIFFEDNGLKKVIEDFPKLKFQGKGHEFEDLKVLMAAYKKWLKDLYPFQDDFEDLIWQARDVLQKKEEIEGVEGEMSDPKQLLHQLRFHYKRGKVKADSETARRVAENRAAALERKRQREAQVHQVQDATGSGGTEAEPKNNADSERAKRVAENRAAALKRKMEREAEAEFEAFGMEEFEEDVFGFGAME